MAYLKDISAILGLSVSTVSKALNGYTEISEETREKVLRAAEEIDYRYRDRKPANHSAPAADAIGVLAPGISKLMESDYYREMLCAMVEEAAECGRDLMIMGAEPSDSGMSWIGRAASQKIAGICLLAGTEWLYSGKIVNLFESGIPMVSIEHEVSGYTSVYNSRRENIRLLLTHMKKRGHSKIAHMGVLSLESERIASVLCTEERVVHVVLVAAAPVDAAREAVLAEDLVDLAAHRDGVFAGGGRWDGGSRGICLWFHSAKRMKSPVVRSLPWKTARANWEKRQSGSWFALQGTLKRTAVRRSWYRA